MLLAFVIGLIAAMFSIFSPQAQLSDSQPWHDRMQARVMAQQFLQYKNMVRNYDSDLSGVSFGEVADSVLAPHGGYEFPAFDHNASIDANGWTYVWTEVSGSFYDTLYQEAEGPRSLCRVISTRQCVSASSTTALLGAASVPSYIPTGSTVYAWRH